MNQGDSQSESFTRCQTGKALTSQVTPNTAQFLSLSTEHSDNLTARPPQFISIVSSLCELCTHCLRSKWKESTFKQSYELLNKKIPPFSYNFDIRDVCMQTVLFFHETDPKKCRKVSIFYGGWLVSKIFEESQHPAIQTKIVGNTAWRQKTNIPI